MADDEYGYPLIEFMEKIPYDEEKILLASRLYKNWQASEDDPNDQIETKMIIEGRKKCLEYLKEKLQYDREWQIHHLTKEVIDWSLTREKNRRLMTGNDLLEYPIQYHPPYISYPEKEGKCLFDEYDIRFFDHYRKGIHSLATKNFSQQIYLNTMKIGMLHAEKTLKERQDVTKPSK